MYIYIYDFFIHLFIYSYVIFIYKYIYTYIYIYICVCVLIRCSHHVPIHPFLVRWKGYSEAYGSVYYDSWRAVVCVTMRECCKQISVCRLLTARQSPPPFFWALDWID